MTTPHSTHNQTQLEPRAITAADATATWNNTKSQTHIWPVPIQCPNFGPFHKPPLLIDRISCNSNPRSNQGPPFSSTQLRDDHASLNSQSDSTRSTSYHCCRRCYCCYMSPHKTTNTHMTRPSWVPELWPISQTTPLNIDRPTELFRPIKPHRNIGWREAGLSRGRPLEGLHHVH